MTDNVYSPCETCRFAEWQRTANGRRHPSGDGECTLLGVATLAYGDKRISRHAKWMASGDCSCYQPPLSGTKRADE